MIFSKNLLFVFILLVLGFTSTSFAIENTTRDTIPTPIFFSKLKEKLQIKKDTTQTQLIVVTDSVMLRKIDSLNKHPWSIKSLPGIIVTQTSFTNWAKGGNNSIAGILSFKGDYNYQKGSLFWQNAVNLRYGSSKENGIVQLQKTDDIIDLKSTVGYKTAKNSKWSYSGEFALVSQFDKGYKDKERETLISNFFAPAKMRLGIGATYTNKKENFTFRISPLTNQITFVLDQELANQGAYGVTPAVKNEQGLITKKGENINSELGTLIQFTYKTKLFENIDFELKSSFYSDYIENYGNIDSDIEININMKVNKFVNSRISSHLLYDDDTKITTTDGSEVAKIQLKQILGVGVSYLF